MPQLIRETSIGKKRSTWITPNILQQMRSRDYFKNKFETTKDISTWNLYKKARNEVNNNLKQSKRDYFSTNLDIPCENQHYFNPILSLFYFLFYSYRKAILFLTLSYCYHIYKSYIKPIRTLF
jgi:hypothetical protein